MFKGRIPCVHILGFKAHKIEKDLDSQHHGSLWSLFSTSDSSFSFPFLVSQTPYHLTSSTITMAASFISLSLTPKAKPISVMEPNVLSQPPDEQEHPATSQRGTDTSSHPEHQGETEQEERRGFTPAAAQKDSHPCHAPSLPSIPSSLAGVQRTSIHVVRAHRRKFFCNAACLKSQKHI